MALSALKSWSAGEVLTAADLNAEFGNIYSNPISLISPISAAFDLDGNELILDGDGDTSITADSDDRMDFRIAGVDALQVGHDTANTSAFLLIDPGAFTAQANTDIARVHVENDAAVTVPTGTTAIAAALRVEEPNLTATGTITSAVTLYIAAPPTEGGTNNYALWVDAGATQLDGTLAVGGATTLSGDMTLAVSDSRTNSVDVPVIIRSTTSGTPAAGIGTGIQFDAESGDEDPSVFGRLDFAATDVSAGSEDTYAEILLRTAGAAVGSRYRFAATGANNAVFTHANSADRTYTFPDEDVTIFNNPLTTQGDVLYHNDSTVARLAAGTSGQFLQTLGSGSNPQFADTITLAAAQATTSGDNFDFTSLPAGLNLITVICRGVSLSSTGNLLIQLGTSGGLVTSGYVSTSLIDGGTASNSTAGFIIHLGNAANVFSGIMTIRQIADDIWVASHAGKITTSNGPFGGGDVDLSGELTQLRVTSTDTGANDFDAGSVSVQYQR